MPCELLRGALGIARPKVGIVAAVETVNPQIQATVDAPRWSRRAGRARWPGASSKARSASTTPSRPTPRATKGIASQVAGDADLLVVPDLNAGNMLYKSFVYIGGGECAGLVLGAKVPIVLTSRADSLRGAGGVGGAGGAGGSGGPADLTARARGDAAQGRHGSGLPGRC